MGLGKTPETRDVKRVSRDLMRRAFTERGRITLFVYTAPVRRFDDGRLTPVVFLRVVFAHLEGPLDGSGVQCLDFVR